MIIKDFSQYKDEEIIRLFHQGDEAAMDFLLEKHKGLVRKKARALYLIGGDNDDLIQEGMIALYKAIRVYDANKDSSFLTFAGVCIDHHLYNVIKGANCQKNSPLNTYISLDAPADKRNSDSRETLADTLQPAELINPEDILIDRENVTDLESAMENKLSAFEKEVVSLYIDGCDYQEIAKKINKSAKSIDNALQRIKKKLMTGIEPVTPSLPRKCSTTEPHQHRK